MIHESDKSMIDKRHIAIVLAVGLLLSVGCVVSQRAINQQVGWQAERLPGLALGGLEQQNTQSINNNPLTSISELSELPKPIIEESPIQGGRQVGELPSAIPGYSEHPGMASMAANTDELGISNLGEVPINWNGVSPKITSYTIDHYVSGESPKYLANIACFEAGGKIVGHVAFVNDDIYDPTYYLEVLELSEIDEILQEKYWSHVILLTIPYSRYDDIVDVFRNDREIRLYYNLDSPSNSPSGGIVSKNTVMQNAH